MTTSLDTKRAATNTAARSRVRLLLGLCAAAALSTGFALAQVNHGEHEGRAQHEAAEGKYATQAQRQATAAMPAYAKECGDCHVPYPAGMLPAVSWQRLMSNLGQHFGVDASLDAAQAKSLEEWLVRHASTRETQAPPQDRITRTQRFARIHDEVRAEVWKRAAVKSPANCEACHRNAASGNYNEHEVRIPR